MNETYVTLAGRVVADPQRRTTKLGNVPFATFRLASTSRRYNPSTKEYEDGGTNFVNVTAFRALGLNLANSVKRGDPVIVHGRLRVNTWQREDKSYGTNVEVDAYSVGHDLSFGTTAFTKVSRAQLDQGDRMADEAVQDAMAEPGYLGEEPPPDVRDAAASAPQPTAPDGPDPETDPYEVIEAGRRPERTLVPV